MNADTIPHGREAERRWRELAWQDRTALLFGRRFPETKAEARTAVGYARLLRQRSVLISLLGGAGALVGWLLLSLVFGSPLSEAGGAVAALSVAVVLGLVVFATNLFVARGQARRLERRAAAALEDDASVGSDHSG